MARKPKRPPAPFPVLDDLDRPLQRAYWEACDLVIAAAARHSVDDAIRAARALCDLGAVAAYPVATLIAKIPSEARRLLLVHAMRDIPPVLGIDVFTPPMRVAADDPSERVRKAASETIAIFREHAHAKFARIEDAGGAPGRDRGRGEAASGERVDIRVTANGWPAVRAANVALSLS